MSTVRVLTQCPPPPPAPKVEKYVIEVTPDVAEALQGILSALEPGKTGEETMDRWEKTTRPLHEALYMARRELTLPPRFGRLVFTPYT